jgi:hypothetical protein
LRGGALSHGCRSVPGFPFLAPIIAIFSGAQMFALGMIGEYLARMHFRMMERPTYLVWESTDDKSVHEKEIPAQALFAAEPGWSWPRRKKLWMRSSENLPSARSRQIF